MLYDNYEARIQNIAKLRDKIIKYKILIIIFIALLFTSLTAFSVTNGMITEDLKSVSSIQYGEDLDLNAKVLFGEANYEFRKVNTRSSEWTTATPILPGDYEVRAISTRSFGITSRGKPVSFSISAKESHIKVNESSIIYGNDFTFSADLNDGDYFSDTSVIYEDFILTTDVKPDLNNLKVLNKQGVDVTSAYIFTEEITSVTFIPRTINVSLDNKTKVYDGLELTSDEYSVSNLLDNHNLLLDVSGSIKNFGKVSNVINGVEVYCGDINISHMYKVITTNGTLEVTKRDVLVTTSSDTKVYDGDELFNLSYNIDNLVDNENISILSNSNIVYYGETKNILVLNIVNEDNINNYNIKYSYGTLSITKRDIVILTNDGSKTYDGTDLYNNGYIIKNDGLVKNDLISVIDNTKIKFFGEVDNVLEIKISNGIDITDSYNVIYEYGKLSINARSIIVNTATNSFIYDDTEHKDITHNITNFISYDRSEVILNSTIVNVGTIENKLEVNLYNGNRNINDCYNIEYNYGDLTVTKRVVNVKTASGSKIYDGTELTVEGWEYNSSEYTFVEGHVFNVVNIGSVTEVDQFLIGNTLNEYSSYSITKNNVDIEDNYQINISLGLLTIGRRPITVKTNSAIKVYDDTELVCNGEDDFEFISELKLVLNHKLTMNITGSITDVLYDDKGINIGTDNTAESAVIYSGNNDVSYNYEITIEFGTLKVTPRMISIISLYAEKVYDGEKLVKNGKYDWEYLSDNTKIVEGHSLEVTINSYLIDVNSIDNLISEVKILKNLEGSLIDVTKNYIVAKSSEKLVVTPREVTITTDSETKTYDDIELVKHSYSYVEDSLQLVLDHRFIINYTGKIINVGEVDNTYNDMVIYSGSVNVTKNYDVTILLGKLIVETRKIVVTTKTDSLIYNGEFQYNKNYTIDNLVQSHSSYIDDITGEKNVIENGINKYTIKINNSNSDVTGNYEIDYTYGKLEIQKRVVVITTLSDEKIYDGTPLTMSGWNVVSEMEFVAKHSFNINVIGTITNVLYLDGEVVGVDNIYSNYTIYDGVENVISNYDITVNLGTLKINPKEINIQINSNSKVYDGYELTEDGYKFINNTSLVSSETIFFDIVGSILEVGTEVNTYDVDTLVVKKSDNSLSTSNYSITILDGELEILIRNIYIKTEDASKVYDGLELTNDSYIYTNEEYKVLGNLNHYLDIDIIGSIINVGTTPNICSKEVVVRYEVGTVNNNYKVHLELGELEIIKRVIDIYTVTDEKIYDGTSLENFLWDYVEGSTELVDSNDIKHTLIYTMSKSIINAGTVSNLISITDIQDQTGQSVIDNYGINVTEGTLTITQREITIESQGKTIEYDGQELFNKELIFEVLNGDRGLVLTDSIKLEDYASITLVDKVKNKVTVDILNSNGDVITSNYLIEYICEAYLEITKRVITISTNSMHETYQGIYFFDCELTPSRILGYKDEFFIQDYTEEYRYGTYRNEVIYQIVRDDVDVTYCYEITDEFGTIIIDKLIASYISGSSDKIYDGEILFNKEIVVSIPEIDTLELTDWTKVKYFTNGKVDNVFEFIITNPDFGDVTENYDFRDNEYGTLEIFKREITITTGSETFEYDGEEHYYKEYVESILFVDEFRIEFLNSVTNVSDGEKDNIIKVTILNEEAIDSYDIHVEEGIIKVSPREVEVEVVYVEKVYDGLELTSNLINADRLVTGHELTIETDGSVTDASEVANNYIEGSEILIGTDISNYNFKFINSTLKVIPKDIVITTGAASKPYDGTPLTYDNTSHTDLVGSDEISYTVIGTRTDVGESENIISEVVFVVGNPNNYNIVEDFGNLIITQSKIFVYTGSSDKVYDDTILVEHSYIIKDEAGNILDLTLENPIFTGGIINAGYTANTLDETSLSISGDVNNFYIIEVVEGTLEVIRRAVEVTTETNLELEYNGLDQVCSGISTKQETGTFVPGHTLEVNGIISLKNFDNITYKNIFSVSVFKEGEDVSDNYYITYVYGEMKIVQREITVFVIDGQAYLEYNGYYQGLSNEHLTATNLVVSHTINVLSSNGAIRPSEIKVTNSYEVDIYDGVELVSYNYIINYTDNDEYLEITKATVVLQTKSEEFLYTGEEHFNNGYTSIIGSIANTDKFYFVDTTKVITVGTYDNEYKDYVLLSPNLLEGEDISVLYNIEISSELGQLVVIEMEIVIKTKDDHKDYDGTALYNNKYDFLGENRLPEGHELVLIESLEITDVILVDGMPAYSKNTFVDYIITNEKGEDVTSSFEVGVEYGNLIIFPREIKVSVYNIEKLPQANSNFENKYINYKHFTILNKEDLLDHVFTTNAIEYGEENLIKLVESKFMIGDKDNSHNFIVTQEGGTITYNKIKLSIIADSLEVDYTGEVFFIESYTLEGDIHSAHTIEVSVSGFGFKRGEYVTKINSISIKDSQGNELVERDEDGNLISKYYDLTLVEGLIKIK